MQTPNASPTNWDKKTREPAMKRLRLVAIKGGHRRLAGEVQIKGGA